MTQVRPIIFILAVAALVLGSDTRLLGQSGCVCTNCPQNIPDLFDIDFFVNVSGATNNDLASPAQGVCGVNVHFQHNYVGDILIQLISPGNDTVDLVGPVGVNASGGTSFTDFDIHFVPCAVVANPDPGFADTWNNLQPWGAFGDYDGEYWPNDGCLENFDFGPVNGLWKLHVEDQQGFDLGQLFTWEIIFCDGAGIVCNTCIANAGNLNQPDLAACQGSSSLVLDLPPSYPVANPAPPSATYGYTYIIGALSTGIILDFDPVPDLSDMPPGVYTVYGLSFLTVQTPQIPSPNGALTVAQLSTQLLSPMPPFCGDVSGNSVNVTVTIGSPVSDSLLIKTICADSCQLFYGKKFCKTIDTTLVLNDVGGCTHEARLDLRVLPKAQATYQNVICKGECSTVPGFLGKCSAGTFSRKDVSAAGCDSTTTLVLLVNEPIANLTLPASLSCQKDTVWLDGKSSSQPPNVQYFWSGAGLVLPVLGDSARATLAGNYRLIVEKTLLTRVCRDTADVILNSTQEILVPKAGADATVCGLFSVDLKGLPSAAGSSAKWRLLAGPSAATFLNDAAFSTTATVAQMGLFQFELSEKFGFCEGRDTVSILFSEKPTTALPVILCDATSQNFTVSFNITAGQIPFLVNGSAISGASFSSASFPSGSTFGFLISSADGCKSDSIKGQKNCACQTFAGTMPTGVLPLCEGEKATIQQPSNAVLDPNDVFIFVLHNGSGAALGQIFETNSTGVFEKTPSLSFNVIYYVSAVVGNSNGSGGVAASDPCRSVAAGQPIIFLKNPIADASSDATICELVFQMNAAVLSAAGAGGEWSILAQPVGTTLSFLDKKNPKTMVSASETGVFRLEWMVEENGCEARDTVVLTFSEKPKAAMIADVCEATGQFYRTSFEIIGGVPPFKVDGSVLVGTAFQSALIGSGLMTFFVIEDKNGCRSDTIFRQKDCGCPTAAGTMSNMLLEGCEEAILTATHLGGEVLAPFDATAFVLHAGNSTVLGTVLGINQTGVFAFKPMTMMPETQYFVSFVVGSVVNGLPDLAAPCTKISVGQPIIWHDSPPANAGIDAYFCGKTGQLVANNIVGGVWTVVKTATPTSTTFLQSTISPITDITVSDLGVYRFMWTVSWPNGCVSKDSVDKFFQEKPFVSPILELCNAANDSFSISFTIISGTAPFTAMGTAGVLNDIFFQSGMLQSGTSYSVKTTDTNGCVAMASGTHNCLCNSNAGAMAASTLAFCQSEIAEAQFLGGATGDTTFFILHDQPSTTLGTVISMSPSPIFSFDPATMDFGKTYFISAASAPKNPATGQVILTSPCFEISAGQPVFFWPEPSALLQILPQNICEGESATLKITLSGAAPFSISWSENGQPFSQNAVSGIFEKIVTPSLSTIYTLLAAADGSPAACAATLGVAQNLEVQKKVDAQILAKMDVCNNAAFGSTFDFSSAILSGDATGFWQDLDGSGAAGVFPILDFDGVATGDFLFKYTTSAAVFPCENVSRELKMTVKNCPCPSVLTTAPPVLCEGSVANFPLQTLLSTTAAGTWTLTNWPTGAVVLPSISGQNLMLAGVKAGIFELTFSLNQTPPAACSKSSSQLLVIEKKREAGFSLPTATFCEATDSTLILNQFLTGEDSVGTWSQVLPTAPAAGFDAFLGKFSTKTAGFGLFRFRYEATAGAACPSDEAFFEVKILENPTADAGPNQFLDCKNSVAVELGSSATTTGAGILTSWKNAAGATVSTSEKMTTSAAGVFVLEVKNSATGCAASDSAAVFEPQNPLDSVILEVKNPLCEADKTGSIAVKSVVGGTAPVLFSIDGGAFSSLSFWPNLSAGRYAIAAEDVFGCFWKDSLVEIVVGSMLSLDIGTDLNLTLGDTAKIYAAISPANANVDTIIWSPLLQPQNAGTEEQIFIPQFSRILSATVIDAAGCRATDQILVAVEESRRVFVPNIFAPNSDENNRLSLFGGPEVIEVKRFEAFDRWGERLFLREKIKADGDPMNGWDGFFRGERMPPGVYVWTAEVEFLDQKTELLKGNFLLVR